MPLTAFREKHRCKIPAWLWREASKSAPASRAHHCLVRTCTPKLWAALPWTGYCWEGLYCWIWATTLHFKGWERDTTIGWLTFHLIPALQNKKYPSIPLCSGYSFLMLQLGLGFGLHCRNVWIWGWRAGKACFFLLFLKLILFFCIYRSTGISVCYVAANHTFGEGLKVWGGSGRWRARARPGLQLISSHWH